VFSKISRRSGLATGELMGSSLNPYPSHAGGGIPRPPARPYPATNYQRSSRNHGNRIKKSQTNLRIGKLSA
jgi:hypothetical protein